MHSLNFTRLLQLATMDRGTQERVSTAKMARRKPFSGKAKKKQLQEKRERLRERALEEEEERYRDLSPPPDRSIEPAGAAPAAVSTHQIASQVASSMLDRLNTVFAPEPKEEVERRKKEALQPLKRYQPQSLYNPIKAQISMPVRPPWTYSMSKEQVDRQEQEYFQKWLDDIYAKHPVRDLNYFEHNLEVWRQLWRVLEISDVLLLVTDVRYPLFHFPASLYDFVVETLGKPMIVVLNKVDLVPEETVVAWERWLKDHFPHLTLVRFTSYPFLSPDGRKRKQRAAGVVSVIEAVRDCGSPAVSRVDWDAVLQKCSDRDASIVGPPLSKLEQEAQEMAEQKRLLQEEFEREKLDFQRATTEAEMQLSSREQRMKQQHTSLHGQERSRRKRKEQVSRRPVFQPELLRAGIVPEDTQSHDEVDSDHVPAPTPGDKEKRRAEESNSDTESSGTDDEDRQPQDAQKDGAQTSCLTVAMVGHPNVGKSALLNGLMGKHVVSVRATPGHTRHLQTHFVTPDFRLCDCPGLVFPATGMPKALQVLCGLFPIAKYREAVSAVQYLAERVPVERILKLDPPPQYGPPKPGVRLVKHISVNVTQPYQWTAYDICDAYAIKRGYVTARSARPDVYRAGHILLAFPPPPAELDDTPVRPVVLAQPMKTKTAPTVKAPTENVSSEDEEETQTVVSANKFSLLGDEM